jgi:toluene monooxygenase electron transfer component
LTHDVVHFEVALPAAVPFEAGQFMVCSAPEVVGGRAYSMVNDDGETGRLQFVVKRKPEGGFSDWLFDRASVGQEISLFGPLGQATLRDSDAQDLIIVAGGSGIAGMMAILSKARRTGYLGRHKAKVFFGVRTLADGFYLDRFTELVEAVGDGLEVTLALSHEQPPAATHPSFPRIALAGGFVHEVAQRALPAGSGASSVAFIAGPPPMVDAAIRSLLTHAGVGARSIRYDKFA